MCLTDSESYYSGQDVLLSVQKYCSEKNCFCKIKPGKETNELFSVTNKLLQAEIKKEHPSDEQVFTVLSNMLLLLNNASSGSLKKLSVIRYDADTAMEYLEEACHIEKKYKSVQNAEKREFNDALVNKRKRSIRVLKTIITIVIIILFLVFLSGFFLPKPSVPVEEFKPFYTEAYDWIRFNIFGEKEPETTVPLSEQYRPYTKLSGNILLLTIIICAFGWIGSKIYQYRKMVYREKIKRDWKAFQLLKKAFEETEQTLNEVEE